MNRELRKRVYAIAKRVRSWTQRKADEKNFNPHNLCGWCAISAAELHRQLSRENISAELHYTGNHCFAVVEDHIVDVTATQFGEFEDVEINIIHLKEAGEYWYYESDAIFRDPLDLRKHQLKNKWVKREICYLR
jgi:hypothetical protein